MRPNWFMAFPLDGQFVLDLPALPPLFHRFHPEDVHLTLSFLGGCGADGAERALAALDAALARSPVPAMRVSLAQVVPMGPAPEYSALSALLALGREETESCIAALRDVVSDAAGARRDTRPPKAHVTLARPARGATMTARRAGLEWAAKLDLSAIHGRLDRVALYTWSEGNRQERRFRVTAERPLQG